MPGAADFIQKTVHALEAGEFAGWIKRGLVVAAILGLSLFYLLHEFRGLAASQGMDQAQIGRELARGHGFNSLLARELAAGQLQAHGKDPARAIWSDTYNAPLPVVVNAIALLPVRWHVMTPKDVVYLGDRMIALAEIICFLASVVVLYFVTVRLFDQRIALLSCALVLLCQMMWDYALSGLPQMLMLLLLNSTVYVLVRAFEAQEDGAPVLRWLIGAGIGFGLLALANAMTFWLLVPALIFCAFYFRPRGRAALIMLAIVAVMYLPWLIRNFTICGNPFGVAIYSIFDGVNHSEAGHMRRLVLDSGGAGPRFFWNHIVGNLLAQFGRIFKLFGGMLPALMFVPSLLHPFRRSDTSAARWLVLAMWGGAVLGMGVYGLREEQGVGANQLHVLFVPLMTCYGLAFVLVLWNRLALDWPFARAGFLTLIFLLCASPMLIALIFSGSKPLIRWPPYVPPYISILHQWMQPDEIIATDMPAAVAWYADRRALWLPETPRAMTDFGDYQTFGGPVNGLYLTPASGSENKLHDIVRGEYKDWSAVILRTVDVQKFPLRWATLLPIDSECVFFADYDRSKQPPK